MKCNIKEKALTLNKMEPIIKTKTQPEVEIEQDVKDLIKTENQEEKQVIIHCSLDGQYATSIRIWPTTYLFDRDSTHRSKLISNFNIPLAPTWKHITGDKPVEFTLIFSALPAGCSVFNMIEVLPYSGFGAFSALSVNRNRTDIYRIIL
jgi:hypothetical protein